MDDMRYCRKCGNPENDSDASYCFNCGESLENYCENNKCPSKNGGQTILEKYIYCPYCGELTHFGKAGYIRAVEFPL